MKKIIILLMAVVLGVGFTGCKSNAPQNLEEYYEISENRSALTNQLNELVNEPNSAYMKIEFDAQDNLMIYKYTFASPVKKDSISKSIEVSLTEKVINERIAELEEATGFGGISIQYIYYAPDNTEVFNRTYSVQ